MHPSVREAVRLSVLLGTVALIAACGAKDPADDLAVAKMPTDQMQATNFLPLNADKTGTPVDATQYLVPGKYTIVEYFSSSDGPSMALEPRLVQLAGVRNDVAIRTIDINRPGVQGVDWQSPAVQEMGIQSLPYFVIYDPRQSLRAKGRPALEQVNQFIRELPN